MIELLTKERVDSAISLIYRSFHHTHGKHHFDNKSIHDEVMAQFDGKIYKPKYFTLHNEDNEMISIAGYAKSTWADNAYEMRLAATDPDHRGQGCLTKLLHYRTNKIIRELKLAGQKNGVIMLDTYIPEIYYKHGYKLVYQSDISNIMIKKLKKKDFK